MRKPSAAFVIEIDAEPGDELRGHVEHVVSGAGHDFDSAQSLVGFIRHVLAEGARTDDEL